MQQKVKLTRRQIKEDKFATFMLTSKTRVQENWQFYVIGAVVVLLVVVAAVFWVTSSQSSEKEAGALLAQATMDYRSGNNQVAILTLNQVINEHGGDAAEQAAFLLGKIHLSNRSYPEAISAFESYLSKYGKDQLRRAGAIASIATAYENQGQFKEAAAKYNEAIDADPDGAGAADYMMGAMRNHLFGADFTAAKATLDAITEKYKGTDIANRANRLYAEKAPGQAGN